MQAGCLSLAFVVAVASCGDPEGALFPVRLETDQTSYLQGPGVTNIATVTIVNGGVEAITVVACDVPDFDDQSAPVVLQRAGEGFAPVGDHGDFPGSPHGIGVYPMPRIPTPRLTLRGSSGSRGARWRPPMPPPR